MIKVEIVRITPLSATVEVTTDDGAARFSVSSSSPAYDMFRLAVHNAAMEIAKRKADNLMRELLG